MLGDSKIEVMMGTRGKEEKETKAKKKRNSLDTPLPTLPIEPTNNTHPADRVAVVDIRPASAARVVVVDVLAS